jgi:hypothetical protein
VIQASAWNNAWAIPFSRAMRCFSTLGKMHRRIIALLVFLASLGGCTMGTSVTGNEPSGIGATALSPTSIRVYWTRDPSDTTADTVIVMFGSNVVKTSIAPFPSPPSINDSVLVTGLASNVKYIIIIATKNGHSSPYPYSLQFTYLPTSVVVVAQTDSSITVSWIRNDSDLTTPDTLIVTTSTGALVGIVVIPPGSSSGTITGIEGGITYVIEVGTLTGRSNAISYVSPFPGNLMVNALSSTSIGVEWTRGAGDYRLDTIVAMNGNNVVSTDTTSGSIGILTGLSEMDAYVITIHTDSGISEPITWMTAERDTNIRIYERADLSPSDPEVLQLAANAVKSVPFTGASNGDLVLDDNASDSSGISLDAGAFKNIGWNNTKIDPDTIYIPGGLKNYYRNSNYATELSNPTKDSIAIPNDSSYGTKGSWILVCQTVSNNLALIEIQPNSSTGQLYSEDSVGHKYITVNVSYQSATNQPYAGRGHSVAGKPILRSASHNVKPKLKSPASSSKAVLRNSTH